MISVAPATKPARFRTIANPGGYTFLLSLPENPAKRSSERWPLILFLHGSAFRGSDVSVVGTHGLPKLINGIGELSDAERNVGDRVAAKCVVVAPQCPDYEVWDDVRLLALLDRVGGELNIDLDRVYLTGLSMGGFGAWSLGLRHPERFAALVPICSGGRIADVRAAQARHDEALRSLGVWAFHGAKDPVVPVDESQRMIEALQTAGTRDVRLTIYPDAEHDAWSATYANPELYAWLLQHRR